jgi:hypothetical protein
MHVGTRRKSWDIEQAMVIPEAEAHQSSHLSYPSHLPLAPHSVPHVSEWHRSNSNEGIRTCPAYPHPYADDQSGQPLHHPHHNIQHHIQHRVERLDGADLERAAEKEMIIKNDRLPLSARSTVSHNQPFFTAKRLRMTQEDRHKVALLYDQIQLTKFANQG